MSAAAVETEDVITVSSLVKSYGEVKAVRGIDLNVRKGEIFGFLGPNGAGKSTTISVLCTLLKPTSGEAIVAGHDVGKHPDEVRSRIGLVFQDPSLDGKLTATENLRFHAILYGVPRAERQKRIVAALTTVELQDRADSMVETFSGGMKRRLEIARGIMHSPEVLFLDEPTIGLDPQTRARVWDHLREVQRRTHITIFMTTHYMEEAEWCDRIGIIDNGEIVAVGTPEQLKAQVGGDIVVVSTTDDDKALDEIAKLPSVEAKKDGETIRIEVDNGAEFVPKLIDTLSVQVKTVTIRRPSLDDVFLKLTGRAIRDEEGKGNANAMMHAVWTMRGRR